MAKYFVLSFLVFFSIITYLVWLWKIQQRWINHNNLKFGKSLSRREKLVFWKGAAVLVTFTLAAVVGQETDLQKYSYFLLGLAFVFTYQSSLDIIYPQSSFGKRLVYNSILLTLSFVGFSIKLFSWSGISYSQYIAASFVVGILIDLFLARYGYLLDTD